MEPTVEVREGLFESPFCYKDQGLLVIPKDLPDPKSPDHIQALLRMPELKTVLSELSGGLFILCTSLRAVSLAASELRGQYAHLLDDRLLLVQGRSINEDQRCGFGHVYLRETEFGRKSSGKPRKCN